MKEPHCLICFSPEKLLTIKRHWLCTNNDCVVKYYQQIGWLNSASSLKKLGRPRLHSYSSETERKAHYRRKKRDKITLNYYFKKKIIGKKRLINQS